MKNYITYRIACTLQLLVFFFLSTLFIHPREIRDDALPDYFALPVMAMVLITILNDGTIISIAYDHVIPCNHPEKWDIPVVCATAVLLGGVACASSMSMLLLCLHETQGSDDIFTVWFDARELSFKQVMCIMYLKISLSDFLTV